MSLLFGVCFSEGTGLLQSEALLTAKQFRQMHKASSLHMQFSNNKAFWSFIEDFLSISELCLW